jgi:hypothetical protein
MQVVVSGSTNNKHCNGTFLSSFVTLLVLQVAFFFGLSDATENMPSMAPSSTPSYTFWREIPYESYMPRPGASNSSLTVGDETTTLIDLGFTYNWFGKTLSEIRLSSNGQLNMDSDDTDENCCDADAIGTFSRPRIAFVKEDLDPSQTELVGEVLVSRSTQPLSFKVTFHNVLFYGSGGFTQASVELFLMVM